MHSCIEDEFQKPSVLSGVVGVALFSSIFWLEIHKLSNLLPYFRLTHQDRSICFAHRWASANHNGDDVPLVSRVLDSYWHGTCTPSLSLKFTAYLFNLDVFLVYEQFSTRKPKI